MEKHKLQLPWDLSEKLINMIACAVSISEQIKVPAEVSVTTPSITYDVVLHDYL